MPYGHGDITESHVLWKVDRHLPYVSSPICYNGRVFAFKNGGLASVEWNVDPVSADDNSCVQGLQQ